MTTMQESPGKIQERVEYLQQINILQRQPGSTINEQIKQSSLYEINLNQEHNNRVEEKNHYYTENYQSFTTNQYEKVKPIYFSMEPPTSHNEEPSQWLPKQDNNSLLEAENNTENNNDFSELLKRVNEALETRDEAHGERNEEKNAIQELFNKINEILKPDDRRIKNKANKMRVSEYYKHSFLPRDDEFGCIEHVHQSYGFPQGYERHAPVDDNHCENVNRNREDIPRINYMPIMDDSIHENELESLIRKYMSSKNIQHDHMDKQTHAYRDSFYHTSCLNNEGNTIANLEEQFTGASLEYWGDNSVGSVEHSLTQSEWNSSNESMNWLQHSFNQPNWLRSNTSSPNLRQHNLYA